VVLQSATLAVAQDIFESSLRHRLGCDQERHFGAVAPFRACVGVAGELKQQHVLLLDEFFREKLLILAVAAELMAARLALREPMFDPGSNESPSAWESNRSYSASLHFRAAKA